MSHRALSSNHFATCPKQIILQNAAEAIVDGRSAIVMSYMELRKTVKSLGIKGMEVHHLIEKRFAKTLGIDPDDIPSILLLLKHFFYCQVALIILLHKCQVLYLLKIGGKIDKHSPSS